MLESNGTGGEGLGGGAADRSPPSSRTILFEVDGRRYSWDDVVLAAKVWGDWAGVEQETREGLACLAHAEETGEEPDPGAVEAAAAAFRYARDLISAEEMEAWLAERSLGVEAWSDHLRRRVLRESWEARLADLVARYPATGEEVEEVARDEAVFSGAMAGFAAKLAGRAAASVAGRASTRNPGAPVADVPLDPSIVAALDEAFRRFAERAVTPRGVRDRLEAHRLDWVRLEGLAASFADAEVAREAALSVREDGTPLAAVVEAAHGTVQEVRVFLDEVKPPLRDPLLGARRGDLVGPVCRDGAFVLVWVRDKVLPSLDDAAVRRRAEQAVLDRAVEAEVARWVRWHTRP